MAMHREQPDETPAPGALQTQGSVCPATDQLTVYFDGACALCRLEISHYAAQAGADRLTFVDVAASQPDTGPDLTRATAMARFHVRLPDGRLVSGAAAFAEVWRRLPNWRPAHRLASLPGAILIMEAGYRLFLPVRPLLSRLAGQLTGQLTGWRQRQ